MHSEFVKDKVVPQEKDEDGHAGGGVITYISWLFNLGIGQLIITRIMTLLTVSSW